MFKGSTKSLQSNSYVSSGRPRLEISDWTDALECSVVVDSFLEPSTEDLGVAPDIEPARELDCEGGLSILSWIFRGYQLKR